MDPPQVPPYKPETYSVYTSCSNCDFTGEVNLPKGTLIKDVLQSIKCPTCGCETLTKSTKSKPDFLRNPNVNPFTTPIKRRPQPFFGEPAKRQPLFDGWKYDRFSPKITSLYKSKSSQLINNN